MRNWLSLWQGKQLPGVRPALLRGRADLLPQLESLEVLFTALLFGFTATAERSSRSWTAIELSQAVVQGGCDTGLSMKTAP